MDFDTITKTGFPIGHFEEWELWELDGQCWNVNVKTFEVSLSPEKPLFTQGETNVRNI